MFYIPGAYFDLTHSHHMRSLQLECFLCLASPSIAPSGLAEILLAEASLRLLKARATIPNIYAPRKVKDQMNASVYSPQDSEFFGQSSDNSPSRGQNQRLLTSSSVRFYVVRYTASSRMPIPEMSSCYNYKYLRVVFSYQHLPFAQTTNFNPGLHISFGAFKRQILGQKIPCISLHASFITTVSDLRRL